MPVFSVVLPTYNRPAMLRRAVGSVLGQTFRDFELIVVDDGSTAWCASALADVDDSRLRLIRNSTNRGAAEARNVGMDAARGDYLSFLDDDDEYVSSFLTSTYRRLRGTDERVGLSWCSVKHIDYPPETGGAPRVRVKRFATRYDTYRAAFENLLSIGTGFGVTFKQQCLRRIGRFNTRLKAVEDADMFFRFLVAGFVPVVVGGVQVILHNHRLQRLTGPALHAVRIRECEWLLSEYAEFLRVYPSLRDQLLLHMDCLKHEIETDNGAGPPPAVPS